MAIQCSCTVKLVMKQLATAFCFHINRYFSYSFWQMTVQVLCLSWKTRRPLEFFAQILEEKTVWMIVSLLHFATFWNCCLLDTGICFAPWMCHHVVVSDSIFTCAKLHYTVVLFIWHVTVFSGFPVGFFVPSEST